MPKARSKSRSKKVKNIQVVSSAMALTIPWLAVDSASFNQEGVNASTALRRGDYSTGLKEVIDNLKEPKTQNKLIKFALGGIIVKGVAERLGMKGWKVGNVKLTPN